MMSAAVTQGVCQLQDDVDLRAHRLGGGRNGKHRDQRGNQHTDPSPEFRHCDLMPAGGERVPIFADPGAGR
jgi:hypothetical protein